MASIKQSPFFNFPHNGGLGFRHPQSDTRFNWRNGPSVIPRREFVRNTIQLFLAQNASGVFEQQIAQLAASLEHQLFMEAVSEMDYMDQGNFHDRLRILIQREWCQAKSAQQEAMLTPPLPMYNTTAATIGNNFGGNLNKPLPDCIMTSNNGSNLVYADDLNQQYLLADVPSRGLYGSRKRTIDVTLQQPGQVLPSNCSLEEGIFSGEPVDSGPTFSGSVLQYDSEASFQSHRIKSQRFAKGGLNVIMSNSQSFPTVQQPVLEPPQCDRQLSQPKLQFDERPLRIDEFSGGISVQNKNVYVSQDVTLSPIPLSDFVGSSQLSTSSKLLCLYITYSRNSLTRGESKIPFVDYLHARNCIDGICRCGSYKKLFSHFDNCGSADCGICGPAIRMCSVDIIQPGLPNPRSGNKWMTCSDTSEDSMNPANCRKLNASSPSHGSSSGVSVLTEDSIGPSGGLLKFEQLGGHPVMVNPDIPEANMEMVASHAHIPSNISEAGDNSPNDSTGPYKDPSADFEQKEIEHLTLDEIKDKVPIAHDEEVMTRSDPEETKRGLNGEGFNCTIASLSGLKSEKKKMDGVAFTEFFTRGEIRQHISSLSQNVDQGITEEIVGNTENCSVGEKFCQLCSLDRLAFPPVPIYCSGCGMRIKNHGTYYSTKEDKSHFCFCSTCYNKCRASITLQGLSIPKINLVMKKNNLVTEELGVQCDKCEGWQHQICALFNDKRDLGGKAEYVCPKCYLEELETEERMPLPRSTSFDASNLSQTLLSDHIEQRLFRRLKQERKDRAKAAGKNPEEVPEPADLVVRVVSSVDKRLKVKQEFLNIFPEKNYPAEFPFRSKVILLFQRIDGVDVCLFAMYVQEFGSECSQPNRRCVYISYLDSVKYFRPEVKTVNGEALRTFVYHEILVGYLDYCKKRGFATCYIWACPPVKGEDYILYCHPETQKPPKPDKLRHWYQSMLKKALKEKIVVHFTNLYEKFFVPTEESNTKVTAARLPYFDGDYWSNVAESMIKKIEQEGGGDPQKKFNKMTRRSLKAMGHTNPSADEAKDILVMQELGENILSAKEDFIIVDLQFVCTHCHEVILSGRRWFCNQCKNYQLCERCHDTHKKSMQGNTHVSTSGQKHALSQDIVNDVPIDTEDNDAIMGNCFIENRQAFLSFCQGNHYQFESLRRAKHSSVMILYHLHNSKGCDIRNVCSLCLKDKGTDPRWTCELCPEFNVCGTCYQRNNACHNHTLTLHIPTATRETENRTAKMVRELQDIVVHASRCQTTASHPCSYPNCTSIRRLFAHSQACNTRVAGGCPHCKKTWFVLMVHSRTCKEPNCAVPRCKDLKKHTQRSELPS